MQSDAINWNPVRDSQQFSLSHDRERSIIPSTLHVHYIFVKNVLRCLFRPALGTLRSNDADGNENVKKTIGFISKTTTLHVHHAFFVHFSARFCATTT